MNPDILSNLLGGNGNAMLGMLIPLLLGGKGTTLPKSGADGNSLLNALLGAKPSTAPYPPLFGERFSSANASSGDLLNMLGSLMPKGKEATPPEEPNPPAYPYELQYNRPFREEK